MVISVAFLLLDEVRILAGFPATVAAGGTSLVTTLPAPTMAFSPMQIPPKNSGARTNGCPPPDDRRLATPVRFGLKLSALIGRPRIAIVDEGNAVPYKDACLNSDALANEWCDSKSCSVRQPSLLSESQRTFRSWFSRQSRTRTS